jgi:SOUL heme-binding protein
MRFSGSRSKKSQEENSARLLAWAKSKGLELLCAPGFAYYDPPWIPGFLRRNEVRVRVKA